MKFRGRGLLKSRCRAPFPAQNRSQLDATAFDYDVAIVGGGIVGATLAAALRVSGLTVAVIEAQAQAQAVAKGQAYAVHLSSSRIYERIGVWSAIAPQIQYFTQVCLLRCRLSASGDVSAQ